MKVPGEMQGCQHEDMAAFVDVVRLKRDDEDGPVGAFIAELRVDCVACAAPMFVDLSIPVGYSPHMTTRSLDGLTIYVPLQPPNAPDDWTDNMPGYTARMIPMESN